MPAVFNEPGSRRAGNERERVELAAIETYGTNGTNGPCRHKPHLLQGLGVPAPLLTFKGVPVHGVLARFRSFPLVFRDPPSPL